MFATLDDLRSFIAALRIPEERRRLVEIELMDDVESRIASGVSERDALAALGDPARLRAARERIEPAFALDPFTATVRALVCALAATGVFAISSVLVTRHGYWHNLAVAFPTALCGFVVLWVLRPRGIGAAVRAEIGATVGPRLPATSRRRAVGYFVAVFLVVFNMIWAASLIGLPERLQGDLLLPWGLLFIAYGMYGLAAFRRARAARAHVHP